MRIALRLALAAALFAAPLLAAPAQAQDRDGPVTVVAHVDVIPDFLNKALPLLEQFTQDSKNDTGVRAFILITWSLTTNHFQLIEIYNSLQAFQNHVEAAHTIAFRKATLPYIGAPYDERIYSAGSSE